jgi:hypothetical protein
MNPNTQTPYKFIGFDYKLTNQGTEDECIKINLVYMDPDMQPLVITDYSTPQLEDGNKADILFSVREEGMMITQGAGLTAEKFILDITDLNNGKTIQLVTVGYNKELQAFQECFKTSDEQPPKQFHMIKIK